MKPLIPLRHCGALLGLLCLPALTMPAQSEAVGSIAGTVGNAATRANLEGAVVTLVERDLQTRTDPSGRFSFTRVPAGTYTLTASYTGLDQARQEVSVTAGPATPVNFALTSDVYVLEAFTVAGEREGNAVSITRQRNADNAVNILSMDTFGNVADGNVGNFMQRLPGIGAIIENGDIIGFGVRGTPSEFNAVNVDGARMSSAYAGFNPQGDRAAVVDSIPSDFIKEIELIKAPTPNMAADSIGGATNLVTKSAFDLKDSVLTYRAGVNVNTFRKDERTPRPTGALSYTSRLGKNQNIGFAFSTSYTETENTRDRVQMRREFEDGRNTQARTLNDVALRTRGGVSVKFDFRPSDDLELFTSAQFTYFGFDQVRTDWNIVATSDRVADYNRVSRAAIENGATPRTSTNATAHIAPDYTDTFTEVIHARFTNTSSEANRLGRTYKFAFGGEKKIGDDQKVRFQASFNPSTYRFTSQQMRMRRNGRIGVAIDTSADRTRPVYTQTYGPSIGFGGPLDGYIAAVNLQNDEYSEETVIDVTVDYEKVFRQSPLGLTVEAGAGWRQQDRSLEVYLPRWTYVGPDGIGGNADDNLAQFRLSTPGYGLFNGRYPQRDVFDHRRFGALLRTNPELFTENGASVSAPPETQEITEDVFAAYAMSRLKIGDMGVLAGIRFERTDVSATGALSDPRDATRTSVTRDGSYDRFFPGLHLRYESIPGLLLRASVTTSYARPSFSELYPVTSVNYNDSTGLGTVSQNNPGISPQTSTNYDVSAEYYFEPVGLLSASLFEKRIKDFISRETSTIGNGTDNGFDGLYEGFELRTNRNFGSATIRGFELNYSQQLRMLPHPFETLSVFANYTKIETEGNYDGEADELVRFVPETTNAGLSWRYQRLELRAAYNFKGGYLDSYNSDPFKRRRTTNIGTWDFNAQYRLNTKLNVFLDVVNAFNEWESWYTGTDRSRIVMSEVYGTRVSFGISGRF